MMMFAYNLATFGDARRAVVANPELLPDAIEESLRFNTSAQRFRRRLMKDVTLHGQTMKEGDFVCLAYGSRQPRRAPVPQPGLAYDITRKPRGHLGFGGGVHACLGTAIARLAVKIAFDEFHKVVPNYTRVADQLPWMPSSTFRSPLVLELASASDASRGCSTPHTDPSAPCGVRYASQRCPRAAPCFFTSAYSFAGDHPHGQHHIHRSVRTIHHRQPARGLEPDARPPPPTAWTAFWASAAAHAPAPPATATWTEDFLAKVLPASDCRTEPCWTTWPASAAPTAAWPARSRPAPTWKAWWCTCLKHRNKS
jgi:hypothetical protein